MAGKVADVHLIDDGFRERRSGRAVVPPVVGAGISHDALHGRRSIVARRTRSGSTPWRWPCDALCIRIHQNFLSIETHAPLRREWAVYAIAVELTGADARHEGMPVVICPVDVWIEIDHSRRTSVVRAVEEQQLHGSGVLGKHTEVHAIRDERSAEWKARSGFDRCDGDPIHLRVHQYWVEPTTWRRDIGDFLRAPRP